MALVLHQREGRTRLAWRARMERKVEEGCFSSAAAAAVPFLKIGHLEGARLAVADRGRSQVAWPRSLNDDERSPRRRRRRPIQLTPTGERRVAHLRQIAGCCAPTNSSEAERERGRKNS